jgi:hypothetical protein
MNLDARVARWFIKSRKAFMGTGVSTSVISVCSIEHANVWSLTSWLLPKFVQADDFTVYVPDTQLDAFVEITNPVVRVLPESIVDTGYAGALKLQMESHDNSTRFGWYLQQFLKIGALLRSESDRLVIWDADCVPVKKVTLFDENQRPLYMEADEYHEEYFSMIERLLGLLRVQNGSFITPGFPIMKNWLSEFLDAVENRNRGLKWFDAIIASTNLGTQSGFSEFETLGTWISNSYPGQYGKSEVAWERFGQSRFGLASSFGPEEVVDLGKRKNLDIISFENWDKKSIKTSLRIMRRFLRAQLSDKKVQ